LSQPCVNLVVCDNHAPGLNWGDLFQAAQTEPRYAVTMRISDYDAEVMHALGRFKMLKSSQIQALVFRGKPSRTTYQNCITNLRTKGMVRWQPVPSGLRGGSQELAYRLTRDAWRGFGVGRYPKGESIDNHAMNVADVHIYAYDAEANGSIVIDTLEIEADAKRSVSGILLTPDTFMRYGYLPTRKKRRHLIEVDRGTENRTVIFDKIHRYTQARELDSAAYDPQAFPPVLFLVRRIDAETEKRRISDLRRWINERYRGDEELFIVRSLDDFPSMLR
jgi:hypothetical protein